MAPPTDFRYGADRNAQASLPNRRPRYLSNRAISKTFTEYVVVLKRMQGRRDEVGRWVMGEQRAIETFCATAPPDDARMRALTEAGVQTDGSRLIWTTIEVKPTGTDNTGDMIWWRGELYHVHDVRVWETYFESVCIRKEDQPERTA